MSGFSPDSEFQERIGRTLQLPRGTGAPCGVTNDMRTVTLNPALKRSEGSVKSLPTAKS